ncbi:hypothetical protein BgiMline_035582, partial [Biomphalaria glabrata]
MVFKNILLAVKLEQRCPTFAPRVKSGPFQHNDASKRLQSRKSAFKKDRPMMSFSENFRVTSLNIGWTKLDERLI